MDIAYENKSIDRQYYDEIVNSANELIAMLYGLQKSLNVRK
jgi:hypothetical protein